MTFGDGVVFLDYGNEVLIVFRVVEPYKNERGQLPAELLVVDKNGVLLYNARAFELSDALNYGRSGKINLIAD